MRCSSTHAEKLAELMIFTRFSSFPLIKISGACEWILIKSLEECLHESEENLSLTRCALACLPLWYVPDGPSVLHSLILSVCVEYLRFPAEFSSPPSRTRRRTRRGTESVAAVGRPSLVVRVGIGYGIMVDSEAAAANVVVPSSLSVRRGARVKRFSSSHSQGF